MRPRSRSLAAVVVIFCALVGVGSANACDRSPSAGATLASFKNGHNRGAYSLLTVTAAYLGTDRSTLRRQLASGKSLAEIAPAGKTAAGLADAFATALKAKLDAKVTAGKLTQAREDALLAKIAPKLPAFAQVLWTKHWTSAKNGRSAKHRDHGRHRGHA
jgi:hypothetical protein